MAEHYSFTPQHGDRSNAPNIVYVMTDGQSSSHSWTHNAAQHLKNSGVKVFVIGIGQVSINELIDMATDHEHVFTVDSFSNLPSIQHLVEATYCDGKTIYEGLKYTEHILKLKFCSFCSVKYNVKIISKWEYFVLVTHVLNIWDNFMYIILNVKKRMLL